MLDGSVLHDPGQDRAVAETFGHLGFEGGGVDAREGQEALIERAIVVVLTMGSCQFRTAFVEHAGKEDEAAKADARTAGRTLSEIHGKGEAKMG